MPGGPLARVAKPKRIRGVRFGFQQGEIMKFQAILSLDEALAAVSRNGDALRYVLCKDLFLKIAAQLSIKVEI